MSLQAIGFASLLSAPWLAKALWAPLVDRYGSARFGRRKSWIVPMQAAMALSALAAARTDQPQVLYALIFLMNLFAATQDIAVDALAVSWIDPEELEPGNGVRVSGHNVGMRTGGGLVRAIHGQVLGWHGVDVGWSGVFAAIAVLLCGVLLVSLRMREPTSTHAQAVPLRELLERLRSAWQAPPAAALIAVVMTYK